MKKIFSILAAVLLAGGMFAADVTSTMDIPNDAKETTTSFSATDGATWTVTKVCEGNSIQTYDGDKCYQIGSSKKTATSMTWTSSSFSGKTVKQVKVACSSSSTATVTVTSGSTSFSATTSSVSGSTKTTLIFNASSEEGVTLSADLVVNLAFASATKKNICLYQIDVIYAGEPSTAPAISANPASIDFGTVEQGADVDDAQVAVSFENLTGAVTYSALTAPFSATGSIENSGDAITISAGTDEVGDFTQTLTIQSAADNKSVEVTVHIKVNAPSRAYHHTIDFSQSEDFSSWTSSYSEHTISDADVDVVFASANKQSGTITDVPVTKGGDVELKLNAANNSFTAVRFICKQWGAKAQTITLQYSADGGENYADFDPALTSDDFEIEKVGLPAGTNAVKISFSSQDNQIGIASVSYDLASDQATAVENIEQVKVTKIIRNGQVLILRDGIEYNMLGAELK